MNKKVAQIFPTTMVCYENPNYLDTNTNLIKVLKSSEFYEGMHGVSQTSDNHLHKDPDYKELFDWIQGCLDDYKQMFNYACDGLAPTISWVNKSTSESEHREHTHPNSFLSGIYYITENPSPTYFESPNTEAFRNGIVVMSNTPLEQNVWTCPASAGDLVIFPSWLSHWTEPQDFEGERMTMSFNIMPTGVVNKQTLMECQYS